MIDSSALKRGPDHFSSRALWPVLALAAFARFHALGRRSPGTDEGSAWTATTFDWDALIKRCVERDASGPLRVARHARAARSAPADSTARAR